jgi:hypothetical protein
MFGPRGVNVMLVSVCEFRENWFSGPHTSLRAINKFVSPLLTSIAQFERCLVQEV